jgi:hypothetical protein
MHEVKLDYPRLTKCLIEMRKVWEQPSPPKGADNCKNCALLNALFDFETNVRVKDSLMFTWGGRYRDQACTNAYYRLLAGGVPRVLLEAFQDELPWEDDGTTWLQPDFDLNSSN